MTRTFVGVLLALTATADAAPPARRCAKACAWARSHCVGAFENAPRLKRCTRGVIKRCGGLAACFPPTTTTTTTSSSSSSSTTATPTTSTSTTTILFGGVSGHVRLTLVDDCLSAHSCMTGDGEPKICGEPDPFFDATVTVSSFAADGTFTVQLDLGEEYDAVTCPGGKHELCIDDGEHTWCGTVSYATYGPGQYVMVDRSSIEFRVGSPSPSGCADVYVGDVVP